MVRERRNWTAEEDTLLKNAVESARSVDLQNLPWNAIALSVPGRTNKDCRKRFHYKVSSNANRGAWTRTEDERLRAAVQTYGAKWSRVAIDVGTRNGDQCSKRWKNTIDPRIDRRAWSSQDEQLLTQSVEKMGHNWKAIVNNHFPGRTALQARNQYNQIRRRTEVGTRQSTPGSVQSPATFLPSSRSFPHITPARTESRSAHLQTTSTDTDFEYDMSDKTFSSEYENDDDVDDADWPPSETCSRWDSANDVACMQISQGASNPYTMSSLEIETLTNSIPGDGMMSESSFGNLSLDRQGLSSEHARTFEQASSQPYIGDQVSGHNWTGSSSSQPELISSQNAFPLMMPSSTGNDTRKQVVIAATCSNEGLQNLVQTMAEAWDSVSFSVLSQSPSPTSEIPQPFEGGSRHIVITASCLSEELGKLMQKVTETMGSISFSISSGGA